eukprot:CAMPEP_0176110600 /NCGR_PEP_ID=MMETSP0120_2-20121206/55537_1 /TAXON_ID=160619 /ORGANISM="Kryptoperidinium foliaceum, Strain CCMP 1326" /LENGTH=537 /DNA_ID=CAMNT_0017444807 /DNA_START=69 /DNA_END=1683 /DNA_ORIENTATION=+
MAPVPEATLPTQVRMVDEDAHWVLQQLAVQHDEGREALEDEAIDSRQLEKTKLCRFWAKGQCGRGDQCTFAHGRVQLRPQPDLYRTKLCVHYLSGGCNHGDRCRYAHGDTEVRPCDRVKPLKNAAHKRGAAAGASSTSASSTPPMIFADSPVEHDYGAKAPPSLPPTPTPDHLAVALARELELVMQKAGRLQAELHSLRTTQDSYDEIGGAFESLQVPLAAPPSTPYMREVATLCGGRGAPLAGPPMSQEAGDPQCQITPTNAHQWRDTSRRSRGGQTTHPHATVAGVPVQPDVGVAMGSAPPTPSRQQQPPTPRPLWMVPSAPPLQDKWGAAVVGACNNPAPNRWSSAQDAHWGTQHERNTGDSYDDLDDISDSYGDDEVAQVLAEDTFRAPIGVRSQLVGLRTSGVSQTAQSDVYREIQKHTPTGDCHSAGNGVCDLEAGLEGHLCPAMPGGVDDSDTVVEEQDVLHDISRPLLADFEHFVGQDGEDRDRRAHRQEYVLELGSGREEHLSTEDAVRTASAATLALICYNVRVDLF